ncbi:hypothetical protein TWF481_003187 [Arthrobotrys musiformis]|uniref:BTB domain-containing protein n=1 Tax=Arthrobotrys musiformis TaxID=47236 RepID=A0AAV9VPN2_9PEZI
MENIGSKDSFVDAFDNDEFADIMATVTNPSDGTRTHYCMHQVIICNSSDYFRFLCAEAESDGRYKHLSFKMTPKAFELVARWFYGNRNLTAGDMGAVKGALDFANTAGMEELRVSLLALFLQAKSKALTPAQAGAPGADWKLFEEVCDHALPKDRDVIAEFVKGAIPELRASNEWVQELCTSSKPGFMASILIGKYQLTDPCKISGRSISKSTSYNPYIPSQPASGYKTEGSSLARGLLSSGLAGWFQGRER